MANETIQRCYKLSVSNSMPISVRNWFNFCERSNILILGIGGGFDICGSAVLFDEVSFTTERTKAEHAKGNWETREEHTSHFASINGSIQLVEKFNSNNTKSKKAIPEANFYNHIRSLGMCDSNVYALPRCGVKMMVKLLQDIVTENNITKIVLVDGGVDSLMHGDEDGTGTILEDTVSLIAAMELKLPSILMCIGFGCELEEGVGHYRALENIAELTKANAFYGVQSILDINHNLNTYQKTCEATWKDYRKSHIHTKVISAANGRFGEDNMYDGVDPRIIDAKNEVFISPLMNMIWYFDPKAVVERNKLTKYLKNTTTSTDVLMVYRQMIDTLNETKRSRKVIPY